MMMIVYKRGSIVDMVDVSTLASATCNRVRIALEACGTYRVEFRYV